MSFGFGAAVYHWQVIWTAVIVHGRADANVPFDHGEALQRSLPSAELLAFDGGSHLLMLEPNARSANDRLIAFLSRCLEV